MLTCSHKKSTTNRAESNFEELSEKTLKSYSLPFGPQTIYFTPLSGARYDKMLKFSINDPQQLEKLGAAGVKMLKPFVKDA